MADSGIDLFQLSQHEINRAKINIFRIPDWKVEHNIHLVFLGSLVPEFEADRMTLIKEFYLLPCNR